MKIAHLTSVHSRYDTRIYLKECRSLARAGYQVGLVVADGKGDEVKEGVAIHDVGSSRGRLGRMLWTTRRVYERALKIDAEIYHLHDPELIPVGLQLKGRGKKVIFDAHEDLPKQILGKPYLNKFSKVVLSKALGVFENLACRRFDGIVTATPWIAHKFSRINPVTVTVNNYPLIGELARGEINWALKKNEVSYIGGIASIRGILQVVEAMRLVASDVRLQLGGRFSERDVEATAKASAGWSKVDELGFIGRDEVGYALARSVAGLVTFLPAPNHIDAQPNKMFEYMSAGVPIIASNFPLWREIVEGNQCGLCVDPLDSKSIADAIDFMINNPGQAEAMGRRGQDAVLEKYNWSIEEKVLVGLYSRLLAGEVK
ncbi:glycosyltransferase family 4 protein [Pseudomonas anuradhapurensis]|uniref:glycosyltransferase family 4 protein n=1 Tax=Pseudomonas anuradhapurensis TaxID=485870 RepID=UPI00164974C2|nr:glycosyltransferase family 4 protein [Pseudomonas anuradhapurensis]QXI49218.1 glycosyltransferase family 4 protein [Pseudomonas anuradhapurensis]